MQSYKQVLASAALVLVTVNAQATTYDFGPLSTVFFPPHPFEVSGEFIDTFNFTLISTSNTDYSAAPFDISFGSTPLWHISNFSVSLLDNSNAILGSGQSFSIAGLAAGDYHLNIAGNADGLYGGMYAGYINIAAVPEPETYGMMLAGLGLIGFMARRRAC